MEVMAGSDTEDNRDTHDSEGDTTLNMPLLPCFQPSKDDKAIDVFLLNSSKSLRINTSWVNIKIF